MTKSLREKLKKLPPSRQEKITRRSVELLAEAREILGSPEELRDRSPTNELSRPLKMR